MKTIAILLATLATQSALAANTIPNQSWTCHLNSGSSNELLGDRTPKKPKKNDSTGYGIADTESFQVKIVDGKIVDGYLKSNFALGDATWVFSQPGPGADTRDGEVYTLRDVKEGNNRHLLTGFDMDGWDHYNYSVDLNPTKKTATVREDIQLDCCDPAVGFAEYDCEVQY